MPLIHLMYASRLDQRLAAPPALAELLDKARRFNADNGITGMLLISEQHCFQVLEGDPDIVDALYAKISLDPRHRDVCLAMRERVVRRNFADWSMGEAHADASELRDVAGLEGFLTRDTTAVSLGAPQALALLDALHRHQHWRRQPVA
ncbi:hypothetical protein BH10PSE17_BH10PSE17_02420 [soil metagenome]